MIDTHPDGDIFDEKYPPDSSMKSDEYTDESQAGMFGRSEHDRALVSSVDPQRVWSILECDGCLYASPGFRMVNWLYYYVSSNPRPQDDERDYQLTIEMDEGDETEEHF